MKKKIHRITLYLLLALVLPTCKSGIPGSSAATQIIPQTANATKQSKATATWFLKTATPILPTPPPGDIGYYDGVIAIAQYYTLYGHGLFEEAYSLLSPSMPRHKSLEEYVKNNEMLKINKIQIITIQPFVVHVENRGGHLRSPDSMNRRRFYAQIIAWGEEEMVGSAMSGEIRTIYITVVQENGEWKIYSVDTAPTP